MRYEPLLLVQSALFLATNAAHEVFKFPNRPYNGSINEEFEAHGGNIDGPKFTPGVNSSMFDWWYFDVASTTTDETITVAFFNRGPDGVLGNMTSLSTVMVQLSGTMRNGTAYSVQIPAAPNASAVLSVSDNTVYGDWQSTGYQFAGIEGGTKWVVSINDEQHDVFGSLTFESTAPAHLACGANLSAGETEYVTPYIGWANTMPGAHATVDLTFRGEEMQYTGSGYHDKNWGDGLMIRSVMESWYWGHANMGPYTLVWFDALHRDGQEYTSGYVSKNGIIQLASCEPGRHSVRPWGANSTYPPTMTSGRAQGIELFYMLDDGDTLSVNITTGAAQADSAIYGRYVATLEGMLTGSHDGTYTGRGIWELFRF